VKGTFYGAAHTILQNNVNMISLATLRKSPVIIYHVSCRIQVTEEENSGFQNHFSLKIETVHIYSVCSISFFDCQFLTLA
jgi:hypothetical protein